MESVQQLVGFKIPLATMPAVHSSTKIGNTKTYTKPPLILVRHFKHP